MRYLLMPVWTLSVWSAAACSAAVVAISSLVADEVNALGGVRKSASTSRTPLDSLIDACFDGGEYAACCCCCCCERLSAEGATDGDVIGGSMPCSVRPWASASMPAPSACAYMESAQRRLDARNEDAARDERRI